MSSNPGATSSSAPGSPATTGGSNPVSLDLSGNDKIPAVMDLVAALSRAREPADVIRTFAKGSEAAHDTRAYISLSTRDLPPGSYRITRKLLEAPAKMADIDSWRNPTRFDVHRGGLLGDIVEAGQPRIYHNLYLRNDPVLGDDIAGFGSLRAVPLFDHGAPLNWTISLSPEPDKYDLDGLDEFILRSNLVGGTVARTNIARQLEEANTAIKKEVEKIASIQRALLPSFMPDIPGVRIGASYETFDQAGGDYYDFIALPGENRWGILIADASGHGPAAAVMMAMLHALMHSFAGPARDPGTVLEHANRHLVAHHVENSFVTAFYGVYDANARTFDWARAGHPPPLVMSGGEGHWTTDRLESVGGIPLGILEDTCYETTSIQLEPEQTLVLYTDGITEARCPEGHMFGIEGIERSLAHCTGEPHCVIHHVGEALKEHERTQRPDDDQTVVVMRVS